jgi:hypothetical protein
MSPNAIIVRRLDDLVNRLVLSGDYVMSQKPISIRRDQVRGIDPGPDPKDGAGRTGVRDQASEGRKSASGTGAS